MCHPSTEAVRGSGCHLGLVTPHEGACHLTWLPTWGGHHGHWVSHQPGTNLPGGVPHHMVHPCGEVTMAARCHPGPVTSCPVGCPIMQVTPLVRASQLQGDTSSQAHSPCHGATLHRSPMWQGPHSCQQSSWPAHTPPSGGHLMWVTCMVRPSQPLCHT